MIFFYVCIYIYIYTHTHTHTYIYIYIYIYISGACLREGRARVAEDRGEAAHLPPADAAWHDPREPLPSVRTEAS